MADLLAGLTAEQGRTPSLCEAWTVHDVSAHLIMPLEVSTARLAVTMLACRGDFDRANRRLTRRVAARPLDEIVGVLRQGAESRFTPPGAGPGAPLTDLLVHGLDIRWPLGLTRELPAARARASLEFLTSRQAAGLVPRGALDGVRLEADDVGWTHGAGPVVRGDAEALLLALTGRTVGLEHLSGDGLPVLRTRIARPTHT